MQLFSPTFSSDSLYLPTTPMSSEQQHNRLPGAAIVHVGHAERDLDDAPHRPLRPQNAPLVDALVVARLHHPAAIQQHYFQHTA